MKEVKVKFQESARSTAGAAGAVYPMISFAFCSTPSKGLGQACAFGECREGIISFLIEYHKGSVYTRKYLVDPKKTRILVLSRLTGDRYSSRKSEAEEKAREKNRKELGSWVRQGLHTVNYFERLAGWPLSKLAKVDHSLNDKTDIYLFVGSNKWMASPHMLSLYLLLIRLGRNKEYKGFRTHRKFISVSEGLISRIKSGRYYELSKPGYDYKHFAKVYDKIRIIMKNFDDLFKNRSVKHSFTKAISGYETGIPYKEGITKLATSDSNDFELQRKFDKLCGH